jgi:hypothetical protein
MKWLLVCAVFFAGVCFAGGLKKVGGGSTAVSSSSTKPAASATGSKSHAGDLLALERAKLAKKN